MWELGQVIAALVLSVVVRQLWSESVDESLA
jgi:hypothetical protein